MGCGRPNKKQTPRFTHRAKTYGQQVGIWGDVAPATYPNVASLWGITAPIVNNKLYLRVGKLFIDGVDVNLPQTVFPTITAGQFINAYDMWRNWLKPLLNPIIEPYGLRIATLSIPTAYAQYQAYEYDFQKDIRFYMELGISDQVGGISWIQDTNFFEKTGFANVINGTIQGFAGPIDIMLNNTAIVVDDANIYSSQPCDIIQVI